MRLVHPWAVRRLQALINFQIRDYLQDYLLPFRLRAIPRIHPISSADDRCTVICGDAHFAVNPKPR